MGGNGRRHELTGSVILDAVPPFSAPGARQEGDMPRLSPHDKLEALKRQPPFMRDLAKLYPGNPNDLFEDLFHLDLLERERRATERARLEARMKQLGILELLPVRVRTKQEAAKKASSRVIVKPPVCAIPVRKVFPLSCISARDLFLRDNRYLTLEIDLASENVKKLTAQVQTYISAYRKVPKEERLRTPKVDHWDIWDRKHVHGQSLLAIAKEFSGIDDDVNVNGDLKRVYEQVRRANRRAAKILKAVTYPPTSS